MYLLKKQLLSFIHILYVFHLLVLCISYACHLHFICIPYALFQITCTLVKDTCNEAQITCNLERCKYNAYKMHLKCILNS